MWTFAIKQKMTAAILLFTVLGLVMLTNLREQRTTKRISTAVTSIYEDRLVVAEYILQLSKQIDGIITYLEKGEYLDTARIRNHLSNILALNLLYEETNLTSLEESNFDTFKALCKTISENNKAYNHASTLLAAQEAEKTLQTLSSIQIEEGKNKLDEVLDMTNFSNILSYLELVILIIVAAIIQMLVFSSKTMANIQRPKHQNLN